MLRSLSWCLGLGAAAAVLSTATGTDVPFFATLVGGVAGGAAGNFGHEVCKALDQQVVGRLLEGRSAVAENHVVVQALRLAQLKALGKVLERFDVARVDDRDPGRRDEAQRFSRELARFIAEQTKLAETLGFVKTDNVTPKERQLRHAVLKSLPDAFDNGLAARRKAGDNSAITESLNQIRHVVEVAVLAELRLTLLAPGEEPPALFLALFETNPTSDGWFDLYLRAAADRIKDAHGKDSGAFEKIWNAEQMALVKAIATAHDAVLIRIDVRTERIEQGQSEQIARLLVVSQQQLALLEREQEIENAFLFKMSRNINEILDHVMVYDTETHVEHLRRHYEEKRYHVFVDEFYRLIGDHSPGDFIFFIESLLGSANPDDRSDWPYSDASRLSISILLCLSKNLRLLWRMVGGLNGSVEPEAVCQVSTYALPTLTAVINISRLHKEYYLDEADIYARVMRFRVYFDFFLSFRLQMIEEFPDAAGFWPILEDLREYDSLAKLWSCETER